MKLSEIFYSVKNGGDGSAYPEFFTSMELAEWDQDHMTEGWGEPCCGSIRFVGEAEVESEVHNEISYLMYLLFEGWDNDKEIIEYLNEFSPEGIDRITFKTEHFDEKYSRLSMYRDDIKIHHTLIPVGSETTSAETLFEIFSSLPESLPQFLEIYR